MKSPIPTEDAEQTTLAEWLDLHDICWFHVPNGSHKSQAMAMKFQRLGLKPGVPDIIIIDAPPKFPDYVGTVIELKRKRGGKISSLQENWLTSFRLRWWKDAIAHGADEAIAFLQSLGYGKRR